MAENEKTPAFDPVVLKTETHEYRVPGDSKNFFWGKVGKEIDLNNRTEQQLEQLIKDGFTHLLKVEIEKPKPVPAKTEK